MKNHLRQIISLTIVLAFCFGSIDSYAQSNSDNKAEKKQTYKKARVLTSKTAKKVVKVVEALERQKTVRVPDPDNEGQFIEKEEDDPDWVEARRILTELLNIRDELKSYDRSVMWK